VAAQNIPQSTLITADDGAVTLETWSEDVLPEYILTEVLTDVTAAYGLRARVDIARGMIIVKSMLTEEPGGLGATGSDTAWQIPEGKVAYALPVARYSSVAWALQPGDHVDVLISLLIVELDEEFQSSFPNQVQCISPSDDPACTALSGHVGRLEGLPNNFVVNLTPGESPRARLVTQLTVQDAIVLRVGDWQEKREEPPVEEETATEETEQQPVEPTRGEVEPLTLVVTPQDAVTLKHALELGADIDLVLRSAGDTDPVTTESVTLQYLLERFNIEQPPKLPYGVEPRLKSLPGTTSGVAGGDSSPPSD
jgi:pilus assembly protein CpaB